MTKYIVTGGAGFIGSALVRALLERGDGAVGVIDNFLTGREANLEEVRDRVEVHRADIRCFEAIAPLVRGAEVVFHLAAIPSVPRSIADPVPSHETNIDGTFHLLRACAEGGVRRVFYAASSSAYGDTEVLPKVETMTPHPKSPYALQKLVGEYYASVFASCFALETVSVRYFNVYGPRQDPSSPYSGVISVFMTALLERRSADHSRRRRAVARLHLRRGRGRSDPQGGRRAGRLRQGVQRRERQPLYPQPGLGNAAKDRRRRNPGHLRPPARRRRAPLPGRHHRRRARPRPRPALLAGRGPPPDVGVVPENPGQCTQSPNSRLSGHRSRRSARLAATIRTVTLSCAANA